jgi:hypothetical protein
MRRPKLVQVGDRDLDLAILREERLEELLTEAQDRMMRDSMARDAIFTELRKRQRAAEGGLTTAAERSRVGNSPTTRRQR